jgi:hypothetical protein
MSWIQVDTQVPLLKAGMILQNLEIIADVAAVVKSCALCRWCD